MKKQREPGSSGVDKPEPRPGKPDRPPDLLLARYDSASISEFVSRLKAVRVQATPEGQNEPDLAELGESDVDPRLP